MPSGTMTSHQNETRPKHFKLALQASSFINEINEEENDATFFDFVVESEADCRETDKKGFFL